MRSAKHPGAWKWWLAGVLFLATVLTYLDRQTMSLCGAMICKEFNLSNEDYGRLVASFRWAYAVTHIPAGYIADHFPLRTTYALAVGLWSAAGAAAAFVFGFRSLLCTRAMLGVGEGFNWPCATRIVANMLPPSDRGLASGIFNSGAAMGSLIAPLIITPMAIRWGWRWAFFVIGGMGAFWIVLWLLCTRKNSKANAALCVRNEPQEKTANAPRTSFVPWCKSVFLHPAFWMLVAVAITVNPCWYFLNEWMPKYLHDQRAMSYLSAGLLTAPIFLGADFGNIFSGGIIKILTLRGWSLRKARGVTLGLTTCLIAPVALVTWLDNAYACVFLLALCGLGLTSIVANYTACQQDFSFGNVGIVAGILGMTSNVFAAVVNPYIGRYIDKTGNYTLIFVLLAVLPLVSWLAIVTFDRIISHGKQI
jgi:MFS transporter, ACS family, hexuronate transporter